MNIPKQKIPDDFNWKMYVKINKDVKKDENHAINHYLNYGIYENRLYKIDYSKLPNDFKWEKYIELNEDLHYINNETEAIVHYIKYGIKENRPYKKINEIIIHNDNIFDYIDENNILYTKLFFDVNKNFLKNKIDTNILNILENFILVVDFNNGGGGTTFFLNTIVSKYKTFSTFLILRYDGKIYNLNINEDYLLDINFYKTEEIIEFLEKNKMRIKKIFINHLIGYNNEFINYILNNDKQKITITHDYYYLYDNPQPSYNDFKNNNIIIQKQIDINKFDLLITQNTKNIEYFSNYKKTIHVAKLPDYFKSDKKIETNNLNIKCCIIGNINKIKGSKIVKKIVEYFSLNDTNIEFYVIGKIDYKISNFQYYNNITQFNNILIDFKPNIIIETTIWPETYSYTLTLSMLTDLPILYLNKPINSVVKNRLNNYSKSYEFRSMDDLKNLIYIHSQNYFNTIKPILGYQKFWNDLFIDETKINKINLGKNIKFKYDVKPYFIYFPQFHEIYENNINFYKGYNDIKNLDLFNKNEISKIEEPLNEYCNIDNYDYLLNKNILQKQIDLINFYGFNGFAIYYYWFSTNTFTNNNMIMDNVIDLFFDSKINMYNKKLFFIWANEDWTNNIALSPNNVNTIKNIYNKESFIKNSQNLMKYFKNENYLKIDNKPVFFIYHNFLIDNVEEFYDVLNKECIMNDFDGINLILNSFENRNDKFKNFYINFNYKKYCSRFIDENKQIKLNYKKYMDDNYHFKNNTIQTIVYDFDNRIRLYKPNSLKNSTICVENTEINKIAFTNKILQTYDNKNNDIDKLLLINAFNEWGEKMSFEPSDKYGFYNINLLYNCLKK